MGEEKSFVAYSERERKYLYNFEAGAYGGGFWLEVRACHFTYIFRAWSSWTQINTKPTGSDRA